MTETGDDVYDQGEHATSFAEVYKNAWEETVGDAERMARGRSMDGWDTLIVPAGDTSPEPPDAGREGRYGLVYVVPANEAEAFADLLSFASFPDWEVYRATVNGRVFLVTELLDPEYELAVYVAGNYELRFVGPLVAASAAKGRTFTHVQKLDGTVIGSFEHDEWRRFFPDPDRFL